MLVSSGIIGVAVACIAYIATLAEGRTWPDTVFSLGVLSLMAAIAITLGLAYIAWVERPRAEAEADCKRQKCAEDEK